MKIKRIIVAMTMASTLVIPAIAFGAPSASASVIPANFPGDNGTSCNAWHGAPGGFGPSSPYPSVTVGRDFGQRQGVITGQNNSGYSVFCNS